MRLVVILLLLFLLVPYSNDSNAGILANYPILPLIIKRGGAIGSSLSGGVDKRVLFDDAGLLGEDAEFTYDKTGNALTIGGLSGAANTCDFLGTGIKCEGTADAFETTLGITDPTVGDQTYNLPNAAAATTDTLLALALAQSPTNKTFNNTNIYTTRDDRFTLQDEADNTKQAVFQLSSITTGNTRTFTLPNTSSTLAILESTQTFTGPKTFSANADFTAHILASGTAPTLSSCGTSPSIVGSDTAGKVTTGSGASLQSCTLTFATAFTTAPACVVNDETTILLVRATSTTTTVIFDSAVAGALESEVLSYICIEGS